MKSYYLSKKFLCKLLFMIACVVLSVALTYAFVFPDYAHVMKVVSPAALAVFLILVNGWEIKLTASNRENFGLGFAYHTLCAISLYILLIVKDLLGGYSVDANNILFSDGNIESWQWLCPYLVYCLRLGFQSIPLDLIRSWIY